MPQVLVVTAEPHLAERARIGGILDVDRQPGRRFEHLPQVHVAPSEIRREDESSGRIDSSGQTHTHAFAHHARMRGPQAGNRPRHRADEHRRIARCRKRPLRLEPRVHVRQPHGRRLGPEVHADDAGALDVEVQKSRPPSARQPADGSLGDPPLIDQLVDDGRNRAALEPRAARQVRPRHRLVMPEKIQRDPPVDLPRGLAGGDLEVRQIDLAHGVGRTVSESPFDKLRATLSTSKGRQSAVGSRSRQFTVVLSRSTGWHSRDCPEVGTTRSVD